MLEPVFGIWAASLLGAIVSSAGAEPASSSPADRAARTRVQTVARAFEPGDVTIFEGPFRRAAEANAAYLLRLEPDRLLHRFRLFAGLTPKGPVYGGWEQMGVSGHTLGHYLSACARQFAVTGDERFRERVRYIVQELAEIQAHRSDGYVGAIPEGDRIFAEVARGDIRSAGFDLNGGWVPWYTVHKLFAGLLDAHLLAGEPRALEVARRLGDWAIGVTSRLTDEQWQRMLACEFGGMNESLAHLYVVTGEARYLELARRFHHRAVMDPLERGVAPLAGLHGNTQVPKVIGAAVLYEVTGEPRFRVISRTFWEAVVRYHTYAMGGHSDHEHFGPPGRLRDRLSTNSAETCNTYNMLKLTRHLFEWAPSAELGDFAERALYNHILASQDPATGMVCYYMSLQPGTSRPYSTPFDSFWCCVGTGIENHTRYDEHIYFRGGDDTLFVNLFVPSELRWRGRGVTVRQETRFPEEAATRLRFTCESPVELTLRVRRPWWLAGAMRLSVNGRVVRAEQGADGFVSVRRTWRTGDVVRIALPMGLHTDPMPDDPNRVALMVGPIVLAGDLGPVAGPAPVVPVFVSGGRPPSAWVRPVRGQPLTFVTRGVGRPADVTLTPFFQTHHRRTSIYWDLFTDAEWRQREAEVRAEEARQRELEARTVDVVRIGEMQPERDHNLQGERTYAGEGQGRRWRHAVNGGWFSFEVEVDPESPVDLVLTYWGSDAGGRTFDILVDGQRIATQTLNNSHPGRFFDVVHPLPDAVTRGKARVTVRLQAHPGQTAGGLFGCRVVRRR
ncbi:MAG TPA: beta-L-arabinofuranosidase domain-containing protein [Chthonomonadales bacterium]|nr:beta-L-arabinofuranosidase domain-containing protein [Chthonomonadales bacterium]